MLPRMRPVVSSRCVAVLILCAVHAAIAAGVDVAKDDLGGSGARTSRRAALRRAGTAEAARWFCVGSTTMTAAPRSHIMCMQHTKCYSFTSYCCC
mmetsp:Transcript_12647/g.27333  ORF Transcript_12647/g.27333 Transcript_12647/m.27333 type:complete len:95 (-) Transcript_12647:229-513(-)